MNTRISFVDVLWAQSLKSSAIADWQSRDTAKQQAAAANTHWSGLDEIAFKPFETHSARNFVQLVQDHRLSPRPNDRVSVEESYIRDPASSTLLEYSSDLSGLGDAHGSSATRDEFGPFSQPSTPSNIEIMRAPALPVPGFSFEINGADHSWNIFNKQELGSRLPDAIADFISSATLGVNSLIDKFRLFDWKSGKPTADTLPQGVAAGDVTEDSIVLWARSLALGKLTFTVYEVKENGGLKKVAKEKVQVTDIDVPAKVLIDGLDAGTDYVYEVKGALGERKAGRFSTAAEEGHNGLTFGVSGDWRGDLAPYPAISNADEAELDFFLLGGDTIYADFSTPAFPATLELEGFRIKYQEVYGTRDGANFFEELRASTAVFVTIDDHELGNNFAGAAPASVYDPTLTGLVNDAAPYEEALQAFQEYHPISDLFYGDTGDDRTAGERELYRSQSFGQDAAVIMLDGRSFRDLQIDSATAGTPAEIAQFQIESFDPTRTMLGAEQLADLKADLLDAEASGKTWKFVFTPVPIPDLGINSGDSWEGYKAERTEILSFIDTNDISNVVFIAGDLHGTVVNNLTYSTAPLGEQIATSAFEITTGSVAFDAPFGPSVVELVSGTPLLPPELEALYNALPIAPDGDGLINDKDDFIREFFNQVTIDPLGLDRLGLDDNLPQADGLISAELQQGGWVSTHTYGWTQFDIDAETQALTVTTWGIDYYTEEQLLADPSSIVGLEPRIVSQFVVDPATTGVADESDNPILNGEFELPVLTAETSLDIF